MGGAEQNVVSLLPYMQHSHLQTSLVTLNKRNEGPLAQVYAETGLPRYDLSARRMMDPNAWRRFAKLIREEKIDVIHAHGQDANMYVALARRRIGVATVMTRHVMFEPGETWKESARAQMVLMAAKVGFDRVIAVSEATRQQFSQQTGLPLDKIETIYNGINLAKFNTRQLYDDNRAKFGWKPTDNVVLMVAVLRGGKGHEVLFDAIPKILEAIPTAKIKLVGDGDERAMLEAQARPYGETVEFLGQRMDVAELLGASDALVLPSWTEALPTVLLEAGAACLPSVATHVGGVPEIIEDGKTGYIVPVGNSDLIAQRVISILQNPQQARIMGEEAFKRINRYFSYEEQAQRTQALYQQILKERALQ
jgi:glycosyltransferase involved in cell wall biosynthesis